MMSGKGMSHTALAAAQELIDLFIELNTHNYLYLLY